MGRLATILFLVLLCPAFSHAEVFYPYMSMPVGSSPQAVAIGDVNGDGKNDAVLTTGWRGDPEDYHIFVFLQNSVGKLEPAVSYPAGNGRSIAIGDVTGDGKADIVVTVTNGIGVLSQTPTGTLNPMVSYVPRRVTTTTETYQLKLGDFNNDGRLDVVAMDWGEFPPEWLISTLKTPPEP